MSRKQDATIADWLGLKPYEYSDSDEFMTECSLPFYTTSDADAITLLPVLVDRGYGCHLNGSLAGDYVTFDFFIRHAPKQCIESVCQPTIAATISSAVLELIEQTEGEQMKEKAND